MRRREALRFVSALLITAASMGPAAPRAAAAGTISMTLSVTPSKTFGAEGVLKGVITPLSGTPTNLILHMEGYFAGGTCEPVDICSVDDRTHQPRWIVPSLDAPLTIKFYTGFGPGAVIRLYSEGAACSGTCPAVVQVKKPTVTTELRRSPTGTVMPGDIVHFALVAKADVEGYPGWDTYRIHLVSGLGAPTNITNGWTLGYGLTDWMGGPSNGIGLSYTTLTEFDAEVTAAIGGTVKLETVVEPSNYILESRNLTFKVGQAVTTPKPTSKPTQKPSPKPAATPTPTPASTPVASPLATASPTQEAGPSDAPTAAPAGTAQETTQPGAPSAAATDVPAQPTAGQGTVAVLLIVGAALALAAGGLIAWRRRPV